MPKPDGLWPNRDLARPGEWFNTEKTDYLQRDFRQIWVRWTCTAVSIFLIACFTWILSVTHTFWISQYGFLIWLFPLTYYALSDKTKLRRQHIKQVAATAKQFSKVVEIDIVQDGIITGTDIGAIWIEKDALHFSGEQTSFIIGGQQIETLSNSRLGSEFFKPPTSHISIGLRYERRVVSLEISRSAGFHEHSTEWREIVHWAQTRPMSLAPQQFVPLTLNPNLQHYAKVITILRFLTGLGMLTLLWLFLRSAVLFAVPLLVLYDAYLYFHYRRYKKLMKELGHEARSLGN